MSNWCVKRLSVTCLCKSLSRLRAFLEAWPTFRCEKQVKRELTISGLMADLSHFAPDTPCVVHLWVADDFQDIDSDLTPEEVKAAIKLADQILDADVSLSWSFMCECAGTIKAQRGTE